MQQYKEGPYFIECHYRDGDPSPLRSLAQKGEYPDLPELVAYLKTGETYVVSPGPYFDILQESKPAKSGLSILTDGVWSWPNYISYFLEKYRIELPEEFVSHLRSMIGRGQSES